MRIRPTTLCSWLALAILAFAASVAMAQNNNVITCSSNDGGTHKCDIPRGSRAQLLRQRSGSACVEGQTYGVRDDSIWVSKGCRADFQVFQGDRRDRRGDYNNEGTGNVRHDAHDDRYPDVRDEQGEDRQNVPNEANRSSYDRDRAPDNDRPYTYSGKFDDGKSSCSSQPGSGQMYCQSGGPFRDATLIKENGQTPCVRGRNWDVDPNHGLWIADGCSGQFKIQK